MIVTLKENQVINTKVQKLGQKILILETALLKDLCDYIITNGLKDRNEIEAYLRLQGYSDGELDCMIHAILLCLKDKSIFWNQK